MHRKAQQQLTQQNPVLFIYIPCRKSLISFLLHILLRSCSNILGVWSNMKPLLLSDEHLWMCKTLTEILLAASYPNFCSSTSLGLWRLVVLIRGCAEERAKIQTLCAGGHSELKYAREIFSAKRLSQIRKAGREVVLQAGKSLTYLQSATEVH